MSERAGVGILGLGSCLPPVVRTNEFWSGRLSGRTDQLRSEFLAVEQSRRHPLPTEVSEAMEPFRNDPFRGARTRYVLPDDAEVSDLEAEAVRRALRASAVRPDEIELLVIHSVVQDYIHPTNGPAVVAKCELRNATAWDLDVACASVIGAIVLGTGLIRSGMYRHIAVVCSAVWSRIIDYDSSQSVAFGDGAAAAILGPVPSGSGVIGHWSRTDGSLRHGVIVGPAVDGKPVRRWDRGGGPARLGTMDVEIGRYLGIQGPRFCRDACVNALAGAGLAADDVSLFVGGQTLAWFVDASRRALGLPADRAIDTFSEVGNIGGASVLYNLERAVATNRVHRGDVVAMYMPGAGFTQAAVAYRWSGLESVE